MGKVKSFFSKAIPYIGMFCALLAVISVFTNTSFSNEAFSPVLIGITVLVIYAAFNIIFNKNRKIKNAPGLDSGIFLFGISMLALGAVFVRVLAFMLLNVDILGQYALITYIFTIVLFMLIYIAGRLIGKHKTGIIASLIYALMCSFDVYPVLENMKNGKLKIALAYSYTGIVLMLLSFIIVLFGIKDKSSVKSSVLCALGGAVSGGALLFQKNAVFAAIGIIVMLFITNTTYKYINKEKVQTKPYKSYKYVLFFALGFIVATAAVVVFYIVSGNLDCMPSWVIYIQRTGAVNDIFLNADSVIKAMWSGVYFERNRFITYISMLMYLFALLMASVGCLSSAKTKNTKAIMCVVFPVMLTIMGILENGDISYMCSAVPFVILLSGYGMSNSVNIIYVKNSDIYENDLLVPADVMQSVADEIEEKYNLPEGSVGIPITVDKDADELHSVKADSAEHNEKNDLDDIPEDKFSEEKHACDVLSGEPLADMLDDLYGVKINNDAADKADEKENSTPESRVIIFRDVIK